MKAKFNTLLQFLQSHHVTIAFAVFDILIRVRIATIQLMTKTFDCICLCLPVEMSVSCFTWIWNLKFLMSLSHLMTVGKSFRISATIIFDKRVKTKIFQTLTPITFSRPRTTTTTTRKSQRNYYLVLPAKKIKTPTRHVTNRYHSTAFSHSFDYSLYKLQFKYENY